MLSKLLSMLEDSREDIGRFQGQDPRKNGTELLYANPTGSGTKMLRIWCSTLPKADILVFRSTGALERGELKSKRKRKEVHSLQRQWWNHWIDSSNSYFRQSAQCPRSSSRLVWRMSQRLIKCRETRRKWEFGINGNTDSISFPTANTISQTDADVQGNLLREYEQKCAELPEQQKLTILCANAGIPKNNGKRQLFITLDEEGLDEMSLEAMIHPTWEGGSVETLRSVQSWMWRSVIIKEVTVWKSWSNLYFVTELFLGFVPTWKRKVIHTDNSIEIWQSLWRFIQESLYVNTSPFEDKWYCWESGTQD